MEGLPRELLYAGDFLLMMESEDELLQQLVAWKSTWEVKSERQRRQNKSDVWRKVQQGCSRAR